jgi:hypothetical protein
MQFQTDEINRALCARTVNILLLNISTSNAYPLKETCIKPFTGKNCMAFILNLISQKYGGIGLAMDIIKITYDL